MYVFMLTERWSEEARPLRLRDYFAFISAAVLALFMIYLVAGACPALAQDVVPGQGDAVAVPDGPALSAINLYVAALGYLTPLVVYLLNYFLPQTSEVVKGLVQGASAALVGVLIGAVQGSDLGLNGETLANAAVAIGFSVVGHYSYKAGNLNTFLGGGLNRQAGDKLFVKT
jgi:hypothetical protein